MKSKTIVLLLLVLNLNLLAQNNDNLLQVMNNDYENSQKWVEEKLQTLSLDQKMGLFFILDGRANNFSKNVELIEQYKPAGVLTNINSLVTFAQSVNYYRASDNATLVVLDSKNTIGIPSPDAIQYPNFATLSGIVVAKKLIEGGNDLAEQMQRIGVDLMYTNTSQNAEHKVIKLKLEHFQKGLWYKNRFLLFYDTEELSVSTKYLVAKDFKQKKNIFIVTDNLADALAKLKSAYNYGQITDEDINKQARIALQIKNKTASYKKGEINTKLLKEDLTQRKYEFRKNELENNAITLVHNNENVIPLIMAEPEKLKIACIALGKTSLTDFQRKVKRYNQSKNYYFSYSDTLAQFYAIEKELENMDILIFEVYPNPNGDNLPQDWGIFIEKMNNMKRVIVSVFGKPDYLLQMKKSYAYKTLLLTYQNNQNTANTTAQIIFGEQPVGGELSYTAGYPYLENDRREITTTKRYISKNSNLPPKREFRAAWIATVMNIDWPSKAALPSHLQKEEFIRIINMHQKNGINAIIFQVSPSADAFYPSDLLPWSQWLTGKSGLEPDELYDPVQFMIDECHKRNIEFHAWFNPYRVKVSLKTEMSSKHASVKYPQLMLEYGGKMYYDPGYQKTREIVTNAVLELVHKYDVDGVHFDDYFYPYKIAGEEFPDSVSFKAEKRGFADNQKDDWRRENVDLIIELLHDSIKAAKPWVKFGISPFGVWRNKSNDASGSDTKAGVTNYGDLYADIMLWLKNDWIDYIMPQVYWERGKSNADFDKVVDWWSTNNYGKPVFIGHGIYKTDPNSDIEAWKNVSEIPSQIQFVRTYPEMGGSAFYNTSAFAENKLGVVDLIKKELYKYPALVPTMPLIDSILPQAPVNLKLQKIKKQKNKRLLTWESYLATDEMDKVSYYAVYKFDGEFIGTIEKVENILLITKENKLEVDIQKSLFKRKKTMYVITAFDRMHNESKPSSIVVKL